MANPWEAVADVMNNGPVETGIAANSDNFEADGIKLVLPDGVGIAYPDYLHAVAVANALGKTARVRTLCAAGACYVASNMHRPERGKFKLGAAVGDEVNPPSAADASQAIALMTAAKVNWWVSNHHTGHKKPSGYFAKMCGVINLNLDDEEDFNAIWTMCHWPATSVVLTAAGIRGIASHSNPEAVRAITHIEGTGAVWPKPADDVRLRITGHPAGTAQHFVVKAICESLRGTTYARVIPRAMLQNYIDISNAVGDVTANMPAYHVGAKYLTNRERIVLPAIPEHLSSMCAAFVGTILSRSTLARAESMGRVVNSPEYTALFNAIRTASASASEGITEKLSTVIKSRIGGDAFAPEDEYLRQVAELNEE